MFYWQQTNNPNSELKHPTTIWTKWSWKDGVFRWWDKSQEKEIELKLPEEFIVVCEWMWVEGFINNTIMSNEFFDAKNDIVKVRDMKTKSVLNIWTWNNIKDKVKATWLPLWKHLHVIFPGEEGIKTLKLKWTAWVAWSDFNALNPWAPANYRIKITWSLKGKKGATTFVTPKFELGNALTEEDKELQKKYSWEIQKYYEATKVSNEEVVAEENKIDNVNDLPFN